MLDGKMTRRAFLGLAATMGLTACGGGGGGEAAEGGSAVEADDVKLTMITDTGGVNDQSFNQLSWAGLQALEEEEGWAVSYIESKQESDFITNLDKAVDDGSTVVWGIGFAMGEAINQAADQNPDVMFAAIECSNERDLPNLTGVGFKSQDSSFAAGYVAARMSKSGKVGFIGGIQSDILLAFENGYYAGIEYANKELGTSVTYQGQWAESFGDAAKGKSIAQKMISGGVDVVFHAAGGTGVGAIEACDDAGIYAIGVDMDQAHLAPNTVITSAMKNVDKAIIQVSKQLISGEIEGGQNLQLGAAEDGVGLAPTHDLLPDDVYNDALSVLELIKEGTIVPPATADELKDYIASL